MTSIGSTEVAIPTLIGSPPPNGFDLRPVDPRITTVPSPEFATAISSPPSTKLPIATSTGSAFKGRSSGGMCPLTAYGVPTKLPEFAT